jgi:hypothetical protein
MDRNGNNFGFRQKCPVPCDPLPEIEARALHAGKRGVNDERVVDARRRPVIDHNARDREGSMIVTVRRRPHHPQHLGTAALEIAQIGRVIDNAREVRVLVIDPDRQPVFQANEVS